MARILLAEDDENIADLLVYKLAEDLGHDVTVVHDGDAALAYTGPIDLALLDVMMPGPNGFEVCRQLNLRTPRPIIIMVTARGREIDLVEGRAAGADDYLVKPFSPAHLGARIEELLARHKP